MWITRPAHGPVPQNCRCAARCSNWGFPIRARDTTPALSGTDADRANTHPPHAVSAIRGRCRIGGAAPDSCPRHSDTSEVFDTREVGDAARDRQTGTSRREGARPPGAIDQSTPESSNRLRFRQIARLSNYGFTSRKRIRSTISPAAFAGRPATPDRAAPRQVQTWVGTPNGGTPDRAYRALSDNRRIRGSRATVFESAKHFRRVRDDRHTSDIAQ